MTELMEEENIKNKLLDKFGSAISGAAVQRARRIRLEIKKEQSAEFFRFLKEEMGFGHVSTITGMDFGETLGAIYHITDNRTVLNVTIKTPRTAPALNTITGLFPGAESYERELLDMFGIKIAGLKEGRRYPLPEDFPKNQHPLRKDWKVQDAYPEEQNVKAGEGK